MIYMDRDADLNTPATTSSGCVDGMVVSHLTGAAPLNWCVSGANRRWCANRISRFLAWTGSTRRKKQRCEPLHAAPLFPAEEVKRIGAAAAAQEAVDRIHGQAAMNFPPSSMWM